MKKIPFTTPDELPFNSLYALRSSLFENVGKDFPREVRNIYYDSKKNKNIYGEATPEETEELKEEGIDVSSIPWVDKKEN